MQLTRINIHSLPDNSPTNQTTNQLVISNNFVVHYQPKLTLAKCRRNVDNFLDACRKIGVDQVSPGLFLSPPFYYTILTIVLIILLAEFRMSSDWLVVVVFMKPMHGFFSTWGTLLCVELSQQILKHQNMNIFEMHRLWRHLHCLSTSSTFRHCHYKCHILKISDLLSHFQHAVGIYVQMIEVRETLPVFKIRTHEYNMYLFDHPELERCRQSYDVPMWASAGEIFFKLIKCYLPSRAQAGIFLHLQQINSHCIF